MKRTPEQIGKDLRAAGGYGTVGIEIVVALLLGMLGGGWFDARYETSPWGFLVGTLFGVALAVRGLVRVSRRANREAEEDERLHGNPTPEIPYPKDERDHDEHPPKSAK